MRIQDNQPSSQLERKKVSDSQIARTDSKQFQGYLQKNTETNVQDKLNKLLEQINSAGDRLVKSRTARDLVEYKNLIKSFLDEATKNGLNMFEKHTFSRGGRGKTYKMISEIDKKLVELTNQTLDKESQGVDLLSKIGEIKGLLVNLYF